uniref:DNA 3'-5' helicase n=1 Tax=Anopheles farauti TaxID=69004 RepID=A0A182QM24_9DIPT
MPKILKMSKKTTSQRTEPMKQMSLKNFISKKAKPSDCEESSNSIETEPQITSTTPSDPCKVTSSPSIFKPASFVPKTSSCINLIYSDSDDSSRSPLKPAETKRLPPRNIFKEQIEEQKSSGSSIKLNANGYDEFDLMVENGSPALKPINYDPIELNLSTDARYLEATKKLEANLQKLTTSPVKPPKFQFKQAKALQLTKGQVFGESFNSIAVYDDDDEFERKTNTYSSSTPVGAPASIKSCEKPTYDRPSDLQSLLSPGKESINVRFDDGLASYLEEITRSSEYNSKSLHERDIRKSVQYLEKAQLGLLNHFYDLLAQIPSEQFQRFDKNFNVDCFDRLKSTVGCIRGKVKVYDRVLANIRRLSKVKASTSSQEQVKQTSSTPISTAPSTAPIVYDLPFEDEPTFECGDVIESTLPLPSAIPSGGLTPSRSKFEELERDFGFNDLVEPTRNYSTTFVPPSTAVGPTKSSGTGSAFVFKKPIANQLAQNNSDALSTDRTNNGFVPASAAMPPLTNQSKSDALEEDDLVDDEEILKSIREAELIDQGRSFQTNLSTVDLITPDTSLRRSEPPRITFPVESEPPTIPPIARNTQFIENVNTQLDDEGWQVYDPSMYEDSFDLPSVTASTKNGQVRPKADESSSRLAAQSTATGTDIGRFHEGIRNDGITGEFDGMSYPHSSRLAVAFKEKFGLRTFRPNQLQVINATLLGKDCFVLMPTGGGKSLCYQLPAILTVGLTIVVSPLKSLILDQVQKLNSLDIPAGHLSGEAAPADVQRIYDDLYSSCPELKLLYVTPEKISSSAKFQNLLSALYRRNLLARIVIDEAHCVSAWGHDFRPDYKKLSVLRQQFPTVPIIALTATANPRVRTDVLAQLKLAHDTRWFLCSFNRPNLKYLVLQKKGTSTKTEMIELIRKRFPRDTGIVYCLSKKECDQLADEFRRAGIKAKSYHAGLSDGVRETTQKEWIGDRIKVVCATIAFGMGIDKPDVRYVLHYCMPKSIEGYYQESGRAGRDGEIATCVLYYNYSDMLRYRKMMDNDTSISLEAKQIHLHNLFRMVNYCENVTDCRRTQQLEYFAEYFTSEQCLANRATACDNCLMQGNYKSLNVTDDCIMIAKAVRDLCGGRNRFTLLHLVEVLKGSENKKVLENGHNRTVYHGKLKSWERCDIQRLLRKLVIDEYLKEDLIFSNDIPQAYLRIGSKIETLVGRRVRIDFSIREKLSAGGRGKQAKPTTEVATISSAESSHLSAALKALHNRCYSDLIEVCRTIAMDKNAALASIMNIQALKAMSEKLPETPAEMLALPHVTKANFEKYGKKLLDITQGYSAEKVCLLMESQMQEEEEAANAAAIELCSDGEDGGGESGGDDESRYGADDGTDWGSLARAASQGGGSGRGGYKRRSAWGAGGVKAKRSRKTTGRRKATPTAGAKRAGATRGAQRRGGGAGSGTRAPPKGGSGGGSFGLLPMPGGY